MLSRHKWLLATGVCLALLVPAAASAQSGLSGATPRAAGTHAKAHPKKLTRAQRLRAARHSVVLNRITRFSRLAPRVVASPTITVRQTGASCGTLSGSTTDSIGWVENYAPSLYSDMLTCQGNDGAPVESHVEGATPACSNPSGQSVTNSQYEDAHFADGEYILICNVPDDNGSGGSNANNDPYTFYMQGFSCGAVAGVGPSDTQAYRVRTSDSIEFYQNYLDYNGNPTQAITTSCMGVLPSSVTVSSSPGANFVACYQYNPNGGGTILGYGETVTYPDRQWSETCTTPNYHPAPV